MDNPDVLMFGMMSSMRTGNMVLDMLICLSLPMVFRHVWHYVQVLTAWVAEKAKRASQNYYERTIVNATSNNLWMERRNPKVHKNGFLITAIRHYVGREVKPNYEYAECKLMGVESSKDAQKSANMVEQLENKYKAVYTPQKEVFVEIEDDLFFMDSEQVKVDGEEGRRKSGNQRAMVDVKTVNRIVLRTTAKSLAGKAKIDAFVRKAYDWYVEEIAKGEDQSKFMYQPLVKDTGSSSDKKEGGGPPMTKFRRYKLSGEKTFKSLFFPEKARVLKQLDNFRDKTGKFSIQGFPHKLGFLLYGPPGTGKTSLVKAVAKHMDRHIISIPLSRIKTNQELRDVMFDQVFPVSETGGGGKKRGDDDDEEGGGADKNKHLIKDVIFLLEDVDAASKVVHGRGGNIKMSSVEAKAKEVERQAREAAAAKKKEEAEEDKKEGEKKADGDDDAKKKAEEKKKEAAAAAKKKEASESESSSDSDDDDSKKKKEKKKKKLLDLLDWEKDKLDLAGLLNVLDGVVDAPGRILIMTTNHPEKLDPALTRPGRVNLKLYMGHIQVNDAVLMAQHYYPVATDEELEQVREVIARRIDDDNLKLSPAEFEQLCAECSGMGDLLAALEATKRKPAKG